MVPLIDGLGHGLLSLLAGVARGECFRGSLAGFTHFIRLLPVQSLVSKALTFAFCILLCFIAWDLADAHAAENGKLPHIRACAMDRSRLQTVYTHIRACAMDRSRTLFRLFSRHISGTQSFRENSHNNINLLVVHNPLVPLIGRLVACSARTRADRQTDRQND